MTLLRTRKCESLRREKAKDSGGGPSFRARDGKRERHRDKIERRDSGPGQATSREEGFRADVGPQEKEWGTVRVMNLVFTRITTRPVIRLKTGAVLRLRGREHRGVEVRGNICEASIRGEVVVSLPPMAGNKKLPTASKFGDHCRSVKADS